MKRLTNKCKCGNFILDEYELCDYCLLSKYNLWPTGPDCSHQYGTLYVEEDVLEAIRKAEVAGRKEVVELVGVDSFECDVPSRHAVDDCFACGWRDKLKKWGLLTDSECCIITNADRIRKCHL